MINDLVGRLLSGRTPLDVDDARRLDSGPIPGTSSDPSWSRPGWPEIAAGLLIVTIIGYFGVKGLEQSGLNALYVGLLINALSGVANLLGFFAAFFLRLRSWAAFGIRATTRRWLLIGVCMGLVAFLAKGFAVMTYTALTGDTQSPQGVFLAGASGGPWSIVVSIVLLGVVTPIGEEFLFRGVLTRALLRYGALIGVVGSALIFALFHGINIVFPAALVAGLVTGELFRRSGSIWPGVTVHVIMNLPAIPIMLLASAAT